jgi:hypothetical protein
MEPDRAAELSDDWVGRHVTVEPPSADARVAVGAALALVPEPDAAAAITGVDGRPRIAALAQEAVDLVWAVLEEDPLVFRTTGDDPPERFARALANALGWPG